MTRAVLLAARAWDAKWTSETPKHLAAIHGEPLLHRTVRQLVERGITDIHIAGTYEIPGAWSYQPTCEQAPDADIDLLSSREAWAADDRTLILYGDVVWTDAAMDLTVMDTGSLAVYCRPWASVRHGYQWGELFAIAIHPDEHEFADHNLARMVHLKRADVLWRVGGWEFARLMARLPLEDLTRHAMMLDSYVVLDDATEDVDTPEDVARIERALG